MGTSIQSVPTLRSCSGCGGGADDDDALTARRARLIRSRICPWVRDLVLLSALVQPEWHQSLKDFHPTRQSSNLLLDVEGLEECAKPALLVEVQQLLLLNCMPIEDACRGSAGNDCHQKPRHQGECSDSLGERQ